MKVGIIGPGKMGELMIQGLLDARKEGRYQIEASTRTEASARELSKRLAIECYVDNRRLAAQCDVILLCTKPHQAEAVIKAIAPVLGPSKLLISVCASLSTQQLEQWSGNATPVVRAMPNTPCMIGQGMTVFCTGAHTLDRHLEVAQTLFEPLGRTAHLEESLMDGATGLSGCGPAYGYMIIESLSEAGVKVGLPRDQATILAAQTLLGAAQMVLTRGIHPAALKDEVTTPAGCTIDGLMALEEGGLRVTLIKAVLAASDRSRKLRTTQE